MRRKKRNDMQKVRTQNKIKEIFENPFEETRFRDFVRNLLNHIEEEDNHPYSGQFIATAFQPYISTLKRIGKYSDGEHEIDILVVQLKKEISLERARTAQRNFIARYLNGSRGGKMKDAALVAFVSPNETDWRFSLIKMDYKFVEGKNGKTKVKEEFTPARRWSFLVGPNEHSHTAQAKLAPIIEDENIITLARLEEAFNIEKVTKEFFEKYRNLFADVKEALDKILVSNTNIRNDFDDKLVSSIDFSKRLLGQIVFLYFLQKKGWFGVPKDKKWGEGDKNFLRNLFNSKYLKYKNFYNDILEPLFYDALALDRSHLDHWNDHFQCKIPFLNGGLFDNKYNWHETEIELPNDLFSNDYFTKEKDKGTGILDIFDRYNFTVKEDEPLEKEVAVDPEMLGKVFENLLEVKDRKFKGTYYTPREIVHYMCEQSLINYLKIETGIEDKKIERIIKQDILLTKDDYLKWKKGKKLPENKALALWEDEWKVIDGALKNIRIVDPACGSGAFLIGMLNGIIRARKLLQLFSDDSRSLYSLKEEAIRNNIYGVDIDPGAVEIAKLRLWLSLVVDENDIKQIKPLPNLDYKIMQGNSLLEEFEGIKLFDEKLIANVGFDKECQINKLKEEQNNVSREYIQLHQVGKLSDIKKFELDTELRKINKAIDKLQKPTKDEIESSKQSFESISLESRLKAQHLKLLHKEFFEATQKSKKDNIKKQIEQLEWELIEATLKEQGKTSALKKLEEFKRSNTKPFFLWKLNFADVFEEKGGFDVVIANPPYVDSETMTKNDDKLRKIYTKTYQNAKGNWDLFVVFIEKGFQVLKMNGVISYIVPNKLVASSYTKEIRNYLLSKNIREIRNYSKVNVFKEVNVYPVVFVIENNTNRGEVIMTTMLSETDIENQYKVLPEDFYKDIYWDKYFLSKEKLDIVMKMMKSPTLSSFNIRISDAATVGEAYEIKKYIKEEDNIDSKKYKRLINTGSLDPYVSLWGFTKTQYIKSSFLKPCISDEDLKKISSKRYNQAFSNKIIIAGMAKGLECFYDEGKYLAGKSTSIISEEETNKISIKYLLAILNSKLISFWYSNYFNSLKMAGGYLNISSRELNIIPINATVPEVRQDTINLVGKILKITKEDDYLKNVEKQAKVRDIEHQIDELVYKLYGLTDDEVKIVESNLK